MPARKITQVGNPIIRKRSKPVKNARSKSTQKLITDMVASLRKASLVGIAAPQVGKNLRIFLTEIRTTKHRKIKSRKKADPLRVFINPKIIRLSRDKKSDYEGCGSVGEASLFGKVRRSTSLTVKAKDRVGKPFTLEAKGLLAVIIQHEMDHLNGIVFVDKLESTKTLMSRNEYVKKVR